MMPTENKGFTLVEVMIALGIFAIIASSLYATYSNALGIDRRSACISGLSHEGYWSMQALEDDLENAAGYTPVDPLRPQREGFFQGQSHSLGFLVEGPNALQWVSYELANEGGHPVLKRRTSPFMGRLPETLDAGEILARDISGGGVSFSYGRRMTDPRNPKGFILSWKDQWHGNTPPAVVRAVLHLKEAGTRFEFALSRDIILPLGVQE